jgi:hypothetical protein
MQFAGFLALALLYVGDIVNNYGCKNALEKVKRCFVETETTRDDQFRIVESKKRKDSK